MNLYRHIWTVKDHVEHDPDELWDEEEESEEEEEEESEEETDYDSDGDPIPKKSKGKPSDAASQVSDWDRKKAPPDERAAYSKRLALLLYT